MFSEIAQDWLFTYGMDASLVSVSGGIDCPCMTSRDSSHPSYSVEWHHSVNPLAEDCNGTGKIADYGTEKVPALEAANWTCTNGWAAGSGQLVRTNNGSTGTATPSGTFAIVADTVYKVTITVSTVSGAITYLLGGTSGTALTVGTFTEYLTATTTGKIILSGVTTTTCTITALSVKAKGTALSTTTTVAIKAIIHPMGMIANSQPNKKWLSEIGEISPDDLYFLGAVKASDGSFVNMASYTSQYVNKIVFNNLNYIITDLYPIKFMDETMVNVGRLRKTN